MRYHINLSVLCNALSSEYVNFQYKEGKRTGQDDWDFFFMTMMGVM